MARDTSNDPVVNLPLAYKFDGNGNIIQKVFFGVNAVFGPVWYWWYFKSNRDPNFWLGDSEMDGTVKILSQIDLAVLGPVLF